MYRQALTKLASRGTAMPASRRPFATTLRAMGAGDLGSPPKTGGQGDAFQRREKITEDYEIKAREREKLMELKKKLEAQRYHLNELTDHIDDLLKEQDYKK